MSETEFQRALAEIGEIIPWWSEEDQLYVFEHAAYPMVMHGDRTVEATLAGYHRALRHFVEARLAGEVAPSVERITSGRGGVRPGAGRPVGTRRAAAKKSVHVLSELADRLKGNEAAQRIALEALQKLG